MDDPPAGPDNMPDDRVCKKRYFFFAAVLFGMSFLVAEEVYVAQGLSGVALVHHGVRARLQRQLQPPKWASDMKAKLADVNGKVERMAQAHGFADADATADRGVATTATTAASALTGPLAERLQAHLTLHTVQCPLYFLSTLSSAGRC